MLPSLATLLALLALAADVALLGFLLLGRDAQLDAKKFAVQVAVQLKGDKAGDAVRSCESLLPRTPARALLLFMLSLELPAAATMGGASGYRDAPERVPFKDSVRRAVDAELARLFGNLRPLAIAAVGLGPVTTLAGVAALVSAADRWGAATMSIGTAGIIGTVFGVSMVRNLFGAAKLARDQILPLLQPAEQMSEDRRAAAGLARSALRTPAIGLSAGPVIAAALGAIAVAVAVAFIAQQ